MHEALHPGDDVDKLFFQEKEEEELPALKITLMH